MQADGRAIKRQVRRIALSRIPPIAATPRPMPERLINVLVVEDSAVARELLIHILQSDPSIRVAVAARDGEQALAALAQFKPDVITMDIHMPGMDGFETTRRIMETQPAPIIIVSASYNPDDVALAFRAVEAGAVAVIDKPPGLAHPDYAQCALKLINTVKAMSEVRVIRRWAKVRAKPTRVILSGPPLQPDRSPARKLFELIAIGASTGGPPVLQTILAALPKPFPVPILITQHISAGFVQGLADWLSGTTGVIARIAEHGERAMPGRVYFAPDGQHMRVERGGRILCTPGEPENGLCPAVSPLFRSVAESMGERAIGVLLTGMGCDGADALKLMRTAGAITFAQDQESSIVFGMPGEAVKIDAATYIFPPERIAATLIDLVRKG
jgi:two-component system chemotaxis response regulator CheB